jgi:aminopeptidase
LTTSTLAEQLADLAVSLGANVQPGQIVTVSAGVGLEAFARELAARAYRRGARFVDVSYYDPLVKRARIEHAEEDTLDFVPPWYGERVRELGRSHAARVTVAAPSDPGALKGLDPARLGRDQLPAVAEWMEVLGEHTVNWTIVPYPTMAWAQLCYPELDGQAAFERLSRDIARVCRLDEPDPVTAWRARVDELRAVGAWLNALELDSLHYEGPGTDLIVGLLPTSSWIGGLSTTVEGLEHLPNMPTEEVFTTPDPLRTEGRVRSTRPLVLVDGSIVRGLEVRFEGGQAVEIDAAEGAELLRTRTACDQGAARLGEVALVDRESRIGQLDTVFYETLLDENATSHVAFGAAYEEAVSNDDLPRINRSVIHVDFMVGGDEVDVTGITRGGDRVPLLRGGTWQTLEL